MRYASETRRRRSPSPSKDHGPAHLDQLQGRLVVAVEEPLAELALAVAEDDLEGLLADPLDGLDGAVPKPRGP